MRRRWSRLATCRSATSCCAVAPSHAQPRRLLTVDDLFNLREVRDPQRSPDGQWVAYTVTRAIRRHRQERHRRLDGELGRHPADPGDLDSREANPGRAGAPTASISSFVSSRQGAKNAQVWLLNRAGGEAVKLTDVKGGVSDYAWSPDSKRLVLVVDDPDPARSAGGRRSDEGRADEDAEADRHRSLPLQGGRRRLSARRALAPVSVRRRDEEGRDR